jgi:hypothetical protein
MFELFINVFVLKRETKDKKKKTIILTNGHFFEPPCLYN